MGKVKDTINPKGSNCCGATEYVEQGICAKCFEGCSFEPEDFGREDMQDYQESMQELDQVCPDPRTE